MLSSFYKKEKSAYSEKIKTKEALGKKLFFDPILSSDSSISCASCHKPEFAFAEVLVTDCSDAGETQPKAERTFPG